MHGRYICNLGFRSVTLLFDGGDDEAHCTEANRIKREIQSEWSVDVRRERERGGFSEESLKRLFVVDVSRIGPRESGESADRQYHGSTWNQGEW